MSRVVVLRTNSVANDPRVARQTSSQAKAGFNVLVLAWDRETGKEKDESNNEVTTKRLRLKAPIGAPALILYFPFFWFWAFVQLLFSKPVIIHACDFDTMPVAILIKMLKRDARLVYDCFEYYPGMVHAFLTSPLLGVIGVIDRVFARIADCVIVPSEERKMLYDNAKSIIVVPNSPELINVSTEDKPKEFTLFYGGRLEPDRGVLKMMEATIHLDNIRLILAGYGTLENVIRKSSESFRNITYLGLLSHRDTLKKMCSAHATIVFYEATNPNSKYAASNKIFEAMMLGVPIVTNEECESTSKIVAKHKCGIVVPYGDISALKAAILQLKESNALRRKLGQNGRIAFRRWYDWNMIEPDFISKYKNLLEAPRRDR